MPVLQSVNRISPTGNALPGNGYWPRVGDRGEFGLITDIRIDPAYYHAELHYEDGSVESGPLCEACGQFTHTTNGVCSTCLFSKPL